MSQTSEPHAIQRQANVIIFGESGAGKSSVVNLILGLDVAKIPSGTPAGTWDVKPYDVTVRRRNFRLFDTVGLIEPQSLREPDALINTINRAYRLVRYLSNAGGINLLMFCMRKDTVFTDMQQIYRLFHDFLCHKKVPVALAISHLEHEENMEDWWTLNHSHFMECGVHFSGHACITAKREFTDKYQASRQIVHDLLVTNSREIGFTLERVSRAAKVLQKALDFMGFRPRLDSSKIRARKLREYGLQEDEIASLLTKINAIDDDTALVRPLRPRGFTLRRRRNTIPFGAAAAAITTTATASVDEYDNPANISSAITVISTTSSFLYDEAGGLEHQRRFPNDLTIQITREDNDPVTSGGFADIYKGKLQLNAGTVKVAIKAIKTYSGEDGDFTKKAKRLRREVRVWLNLEHDNVLPLLGTTMGFSRFPAMVCPWAENGTLTSYLKDHHADLSVVEILGLLDDVASGLQYLHSRSIVHGDLSSSNILINENGSAWITDFGLSTLLTELGGLTFATSFHARGTIRWMAPELLDLSLPENESEEAGSCISPTTHNDVYSFGGVMLQILSGRVPYHYYSNDMQVVHAVLKGITPTRPSNALVTDRRWAFIQRCWSTVDITRSRPTCDEIIDFTKNELVCVRAS